MVRIRRPGLKFLSKEFGFEFSISIAVIEFQSLPLNNKSLKTLQWKDLKGHVTRFQLQIFSLISFPEPLSIPLGPLRIVTKIGTDICILKGHGNEADFLGFLQKSVRHRFCTLHLKPFRFGLRVRRDIRNRKTTPRLAESGS